MLDKMIELQAKIDALYKRLEIEINTKKVLEEIGFPIKDKGFVYLIFAVKTANKAPNLLQKPQLLYEEIAQMYGVSNEEIENEIGCAIAYWWQRERLFRLNSKDTAKYDLFGEIKPTNEEFITRIADIVMSPKRDKKSYIITP